MKCRKMVVSWSIFVLFVLFVMTAYAQVPRKINYQGYLTDIVTGMPVNSDVEMTFSIYDVATDGTALWTETQTVTVTDGRYSIQLGENTPIDLLEPKPYWLGVQIGTEPELTPREELTSALYALFAKYLEGITIKDGKVGIGTDDPQDMLDVHGNVHIRGTLHVGPNSMKFGDWEFNNGQGTYYIYTTDGEVISFTDSSTGIPTNLTDIGNLSTKGNITTEGDITANGKISAGEVSTTGLDVNGKIKGDTICLGDFCLNTWPDPCACFPECAHGQRLEYSGITGKWECAGEPIILPPMKSLYRLYLHNSEPRGDWTNYIDSTNSNEIGTCQGRLGYVLETQISGTKPLYRKYRSHNGNGNDIKDDHMTTDNRNELNSQGWNDEGTFGYVYTTQVPGTIPLYLKYREYWYRTVEIGWYLHRDYITTTDRNEGDSKGWRYVRVLGYIVGPASSSCQ